VIDLGLVAEVLPAQTMALGIEIQANAKRPAICDGHVTSDIRIEVPIMM
jgi:hypothetical protein